MKVLEKGKWRYTFTCEECDAILMAEESDFRSYSKGREIYIACECPECGTEHVPEDKDIPADVRHRIQNRREQRPDPFHIPLINPDVRYK